MKKDFLSALKKLRQLNKERKFNQTLDLIINLKDFDFKRENINVLVLLPHLEKSKKICAFLEKSSIIPHYSITRAELEKITEQEMKSFAEDYDIFIANAKLMPIIAQKFGKILGKFGKMPDPKVGAILMDEKEETISKVVNQLSHAIKVRSKEPSLKIAIGKESMDDEQLAENAETVYNKIFEALPKKKDNIRSIMLKFTMSKPVKIKME